MRAAAKVPAVRCRDLNGEAERPDRSFVLYWMTAQRRLEDNWALDRAGEHARRLGRPVLVLEALRSEYPHAAPRFHAFVLQGMADNRRTACARGLAYYPYAEPRPGAGKGLLAALAARACVVVADEWPCSFHPRMVAAAARKVDVRLETVDACGLLPLRATDRPWPNAFSFRRLLQRALPDLLDALPRPRPPGQGPRAVVPRAVLRRWAPAGPDLLAARPAALARLDLAHATPVVPGARGGSAAGRDRLRTFLRRGLASYRTGRRDPLAPGPSGLSPWLHFGHVGTATVVRAVLRHAGFHAARLASRADGRRAGWWGLAPGPEAFLDQILTWRELSLNAHAFLAEPERFDSLPAWARRTLLAHAHDERRPTYDLATLEAARTHDEVWNAAQRQLLREGTIDGTLRMLWGKKVLEWSPTPEAAFEVLRYLNDHYALDGRDPNSTGGIAWVFGRHDRPFPPERRVLGVVRPMSSDRTRRKLDLTAYLQRFAAGPRARHDGAPAGG